MKNRVVYTSIFGGYDDVDKFQTQNIPQAWDLKCFSENNSLSLYSDNTRNAKQYKVLPHRHLSDYEYSIFIDGNMTVRGDINNLVDFTDMIHDIVNNPDANGGQFHFSIGQQF